MNDFLNDKNMDNQRKIFIFDDPITFEKFSNMDKSK